MTRASTIELIAALAFGAAMTALDYYTPGPVLGVLGALALFLGMVVSMSMQENR